MLSTQKNDNKTAIKNSLSYVIKKAMTTIDTHRFIGRALIVPNTFSKENNSVDIVFASEEPVLRAGWMIGISDNTYNEILSCNPNNVRTQRAEQGLPLFTDHNSYDITKQVGKVTNIQFKNKQATGTVIFGARMDDAMKTDIQNGIISSFSVGYQIYSLEETKSATDIKNYTATDWEPLEVSIVGVPADPNAKTRQNDENIKTQITNKEMTIQEIREKGTPEQMERLSQIRYVTRKANLSDETIQQLFDSKDTVEDIEKRYVVVDNSNDIEKLNKLINRK